MDAITLAAYAEQLSLRSQAAVCCILLHDIVWTHPNICSYYNIFVVVGVLSESGKFDCDYFILKWDAVFCDCSVSFFNLPAHWDRVYRLFKDNSNLIIGYCRLSFIVCSYQPVDQVIFIDFVTDSWGVHSH